MILSSALPAQSINYCSLQERHVYSEEPQTANTQGVTKFLQIPCKCCYFITLHTNSSCHLQSHLPA